MTTQTFIYPNAIVRVHSPDLTPEERERRMKQIHDSAMALIKSTLINNRKGGNTDETNTS